MKVLLPLTLAAGLAAAMPAAAATIVFEDNFASYGSTTVLDAPSSTFNGNWAVSNGTVDYLAAGSAFGDLCSGGGNCIDLDGSTLDAGVFETVMTFGQGVYNLLFQIAGNNRGAAPDTVTIAFGAFVQAITLGSSQVASQADYGSTYFGIKVGAAGAKLSFSNAGGDNVGILLKTVLVEQVPAAVPVPAAGGMLLAGLAGLALTRRRKAANV